MLQLLTESTLTAVVAGLFGVAFAVAFQGLLIRLLPVGQLGITRPDIDVSVLLFALGVSIANGIVFGAVPALQCTSIESTIQLRAGTRATSVRGTSLLRSGLIVVQVAISTVLLIGAGLLIRSLAQQMNVNLGFNPMNVLTAELRLPDNDYPEPEQRIAFFTSLVEEVKALPGVVSVGLINQLPIRNPGNNINVYPADQPQEEQQSTMRRRAFYRCVLPGYLRTRGAAPAGRRGQKVSERRLDGTRSRQLTDDVHIDRKPIGSPDGKAIAFQSNRSGSWEIWTIRPDGSGLKQLTETPGRSAGAPTWSPDGSRICYSDNLARTSFIFDPRKPWNEQTPLELPPLSDERVGFATHSWSPDGH